MQNRFNLVKDIVSPEFQDKIFPISEDMIPRINSFKDGSFGFTFLGLTLYAHAIYINNDVAFGVGVFQRNGKPAIHIIAPVGEGWQIEVTKFAEQFPEYPVYVRHLNANKLYTLPSHLWRRVTKDFMPWHEEAPTEDEHFNHRIIMLARLDNHEKIRFICNRCRNFLEQYGVELISKPFSRDLAADSKFIVESHFAFLGDKAVGSKPEDYGAFHYLDPLKFPENSGIDMRVWYLRKGDIEIPVSFTGYETMYNSPFMRGGYSVITRRGDEFIREVAQAFGVGLLNGSQDKRLNALPTYVKAKLFADFRAQGAEIVDDGGSETLSLDIGKARDFAAIQRSSGWVSYSRESA